MLNTSQNGGLASLTPECLDQLCDLIIAKLAEKNPWVLVPKQAPPTPAVDGHTPFKRRMQGG